ncbi:hypothetical protein Tco_0393937 [Tanacetum coccineum]
MLKAKSTSESVVSNPKILGELVRVIIEDWNSDDEEEGFKICTTAGRLRAVVNTGKGKLDTDLKKSRWVWRPKGNYLDHVSKDSGSFMLKKVEICSGDSGCFPPKSHMTGNKAYLSDYKDFNGGFVAFGSDPKGEKESKGVCVKLETPQQNGVQKGKIGRPYLSGSKKNMLAAPIYHPVLAEAVNTACYVLNRVLVTKPQNKTPYELLIGTGPNWMFDLDFLTNSMNYIPVSVEESMLMVVASKYQDSEDDVTRKVIKTCKMNLRFNGYSVLGLNASDTLPSDGIFNGAYNDDEDVGADGLISTT